MNETPPEQGPHEAEPTLTQDPTVLAAEVPPTRLVRPLSAFRHRNYRLFFSGQIISLTGTWLQNVAQSWLVYQLTSSSLLLGIVGAIGSLPVFMFSVFAGTIADRFNKRNMIIVTQCCAMVLAFALSYFVITGTVKVYHIIVVGFLLGTVQSFDMPTRQSFVAEMVGREDLSNAIALNSVMFNGARILGPVVAVTVMAHMGVGGAFFLNGVSFIPVIIGLAMMRVAPVVKSAHTPMLQQVKEGLRFVKHNRMVMGLLILAGVVSIFSMPYMVLMPVFAKTILKGGQKGMGYLISSVGIGALIGAGVLSSLGDFKWKGKLLLIGNMTFCTMLVLFSLSRILWLSMLLLVGVGWGMMTNMALTNTLIQASTPDDLRGRVMGVYVLMFMGMAPLGSLQGGVTAHWLGAPVAVMIGAICCATCSLILSPRFVRTSL